MPFRKIKHVKLSGPTIIGKIDDTLTFPTPYYFHFISFAFVQLTYLLLPSEKEMFHDVIVILLT